MSAEAAFATALVIILGSSVTTAWLLWRYLDPVFADYCGHPERGHLWTVLCAVILVVLPFFALTLDLQTESQRSWLFAIASRLRWPLLALFAATLLVAGIAAAMHVPRDLHMTRTEMDDLKRLLGKVQEVRARELLSQLEATSPSVDSKELEDLNRLVDKITDVRGRRFQRGAGESHSSN